jgi:hypothetical protein
MATSKFLYTGPTTITCGMDGLASSTTAARASTVIDNTTNLFLDALVELQLQTVTGTLGTNPVIYVYAYALSYNGNYTDGVSGTDEAFTLPATPNLKLIQIINYLSSAYVISSPTTVYSSPFSIATAFGGILPPKWGIVVNNQTGLALAGTAGQQVDNIASYTGIQVQSA